MSTRAIHIAGFALALLLGSASSASAAWTPGGTPVCTATQGQTRLDAAPDGSGGIVIVWEDARVSGPGVYAQRLDANGVAQWTANGVLLSATGSRPRIVADGSGNTIAVWRDNRSGAVGAYAQKLNGGGVAQWTAGGVRIGDQFGEPSVDADGSGGVVVTWLGGPQPTRDIYAQRVNSAGTPLWGTFGRPVCRHPQDQADPDISRDGNGGAFVAWWDNRASTHAIYARHVSAAGDTLGTGNGVQISPNNVATFEPSVTYDGASGAFIGVADQRQLGQGTHLYLYRVDANLALKPGWPAGGTDFGITFGVEPDQEAILDGNDGAIVSQYGGAITRVDNAGAISWAVPLTNPGSQFEYPVNVDLVSDGAGGAHVAWQDFRNDVNYDLFATHVTSTGEFGESCPTDGETMSDANNNQVSPKIVSDGAGGAIVAWSDGRTDAGDIYASPLACGATTNAPQPGDVTFGITRAWPNPAVTSLRVSFVLPKSGPSRLDLVDVTGRVVASRTTQHVAAGLQTVEWDLGDEIRAGVYLLRLSDGVRHVATKVTWMR